MPDETRRVYWDANVFLTYIQGYPAVRMPVLDALLENASAGALGIYTSTLSISEVAFAQQERAGRVLDPAIESQIDALWSDRAVVKLVDYHQLIAFDARNLMRLILPSGRSMRPADAIHLVTARRIAVAEFHTYDKRLMNYAADMGFTICEPYTNRPRLIP